MSKNKTKSPEQIRKEWEEKVTQYNTDDKNHKNHKDLKKDDNENIASFKILLGEYITNNQPLNFEKLEPLFNTVSKIKDEAARMRIFNESLKDSVKEQIKVERPSISLINKFLQNFSEYFIKYPQLKIEKNIEIIKEISNLFPKFSKFKENYRIGQKEKYADGILKNMMGFYNEKKKSDFIFSFLYSIPHIKDNFLDPHFKKIAKGSDMSDERYYNTIKLFFDSILNSKAAEEAMEKIIKIIFVAYNMSEIEDKSQITKNIIKFCYEHESFKKLFKDHIIISNGKKFDELSIKSFQKVIENHIVKIFTQNKVLDKWEKEYGINLSEDIKKIILGYMTNNELRDISSFMSEILDQDEKNIKDNSKDNKQKLFTHHLLNNVFNTADEDVIKNYRKKCGITKYKVARIDFAYEVAKKIIEDHPDYSLQKLQDEFQKQHQKMNQYINTIGDNNNNNNNKINEDTSLKNDEKGDNYEEWLNNLADEIAKDNNQKSDSNKKKEPPSPELKPQDLQQVRNNNDNEHQPGGGK